MLFVMRVYEAKETISRMCGPKVGLQSGNLSHQIEISVNLGFVDIIITKVYVVYLSAEISH